MLLEIAFDFIVTTMFLLSQINLRNFCVVPLEAICNIVGICCSNNNSNYNNDLERKFQYK